MRRLPVAWIPLAVGLARARRRLGLHPLLGTAVAASVPAAVTLAAPRGRVRHAVLWAAQMWAYKIAFEVPYDRPRRLRARLHVREAPRIDRVLGGGAAPTARLQRRLRDPAAVNALDRAATLVYVAWEAEPHAALAWLLWRRPSRFPAAAARLAAAFDLTLLGYWLAPSAPPWWASEKAGLFGGDVRRVPTRVIRDLRGEPLEQDDVEGANPWAAMPSDHFGSALMTAAVLWEADRRAGAAGLAYALSLGAALVYLGEHYVADLLAGAGLIGAILAAAPVLRRPARRLDAAWRRLEPS